MKKRRKKKQYPEDFKTIFGLSTMGWTTTTAQSLMTSLFMLYLTDYSGINGALSAAGIGTVLLFFGRIIDAFDDPLQGWLMDNTKSTKWGKYKPYCMLSTVIITISIISLYSLPQIVAKNSILTVIWFMFFYILYDVGTSFFAEGALKQTLSNDDAIRVKLTMWPRVINILVTIPIAFILSIVKSIDTYLNNMHTSFLVVIIAVIIPIGIVSLIGVSIVKEGSHQTRRFRNPKISLRDILIMFKTNKPLFIIQSAQLFGGFIWSMVFATTIYYIKWAYCVDKVTGIVDGNKFTTYTMILGILQIFPMLLATIISPWIVKKFGSALNVLTLSYSIMATAGTITFILNIYGLFENNAILYFILLSIILFGNGMTFVPGNVMGMECMDYAVWKTGKVANGIIYTLGNFVNKAQTALASASVGIVLIIIGYNVDPVKDEFIGELYSIPNMLNSFILISGLIPAILAVITIVIYQFYPIDGEMRKKMKSDLEERSRETGM